MNHIFAGILAAVLVAPAAIAQATPEEAFADYKIACAAERDITAVEMHRSRGKPKQTLKQMSAEDRRIAYVLSDTMFWNMMSYTRESVARGLVNDTSHSAATTCGYRVRLAQIDRGGALWPYPNSHGPVDAARERYRQGDGRPW